MSARETAIAARHDLLAAALAAQSPAPVVLTKTGRCGAVALLQNNMAPCCRSGMRLQ